MGSDLGQGHTLEGTLVMKCLVLGHFIVQGFQLGDNLWEVYSPLTILGSFIYLWCIYCQGIRTFIHLCVVFSHPLGGERGGEDREV